MKSMMSVLQESARGCIIPHNSPFRIIWDLVSLPWSFNTTLSMLPLFETASPRHQSTRGHVMKGFLDRTQPATLLTAPSCLAVNVVSGGDCVHRLPEHRGPGQAAETGATLLPTAST